MYTTEWKLNHIGIDYIAALSVCDVHYLEYVAEMKLRSFFFGFGMLVNGVGFDFKEFAHGMRIIPIQGNCVEAM